MHPFARRLIPATNCGLGLAESISHPAASMLDAANISFHIGIQ
jgi:hypothetical protein